MNTVSQSAAEEDARDKRLKRAARSFIFTQPEALAVEQPALCARCGAALAAPPRCPSCDAADPLVGQTLGSQYLLLRRLGAGGFGAVYEAEDRQFQRRVALKILHPHVSSDPTALARFRREGIAAGRLEHPAVVKIFSLNATDEGLVYLAMELLSGETLSALLARRQTLSPRELLPLLRPICEALAEAHAKGVIHRDLKPQNIFLQQLNGVAFPKLLDFGISHVSGTDRITAHASTVGTPAYMAPEQWEEGQVDGRADLYALGLVLYQCLAGRLPFVASSSAGWMRKHCLEAPLPLAEVSPQPLSPGWSEAIMRALQKPPAARFATALALYEALASSVDTNAAPVPLAGAGAPVSPYGPTTPMPLPSPGPTAPAHTAPAPKSPARPWIRGAVLAGGLVAVGALGLWLGRASAPGVAPAPAPTSQAAPPAALGAPTDNARLPVEWLSPALTGETLYGVSVTPTEVLAVGAHGTLLARGAGGAWALVPLPTTRDLYGITCQGERCLVVGDEVILTREPGAAWELRALPGERLRAVSAQGEAVLAVGEGGRALRSDDFGARWSPSIIAPDVSLRGAWLSPDGAAVAVGGFYEEGAFFYAPPGLPWRRIALPPGTPPLVGAFGLSPREIYLYGNKRVFLFRGDAPPEPFPLLAETRINGAWGDAERGLLLVGEEQGLIARPPGQTVQAAHTLGRVPPWDGHELHAINGRGALVVAVGAGGFRAVSHDGGRSFTPAGESSQYTRLGWWQQGSLRVAVGSRCSIWHDAGAGWGRIEVAPAETHTCMATDLLSVWGSDPQHLFAAGKYGQLLRAQEDGQRWEPVAPALAPYHFSSVHGDGDGTVYASGILILQPNRGVLSRSLDGGNHWALLASLPAPPALSEVQAGPGGLVGTSGHAGFVAWSQDRGDTWEAHPVEHALDCPQLVRDREEWVVLCDFATHTALLRWQGARWEEELRAPILQMGASSTALYALAEKNQVWRRAPGSAWEVRTLDTSWAPARLWASPEDELFLLGGQNGVVRARWEAAR